MVILLLTACAVPADDPAVADRVRLLARISLDLRGVRPTEAEVLAVEADPAALDADVDTFLQDERFGTRVADLFEEVVLTHGEGYPADATLFGAGDPVAFQASIGAEVPRLLARIATDDRPWTEAVTGDWTMADETLGAIWPVDYPAGETGWQLVHWTDGRPAAGVLATNSFYWRYDSTASNANRKRANAISRIFLCHDYLQQPVDFPADLDVSDPDVLAAAVRTNPSCVSCHVSLDPLAGYLYGFFYNSPINPGDVNVYHPERELGWETYTQVPPGYFGVPGSGRLDELGRRVAADPRYPGCVVQHVYEGLLRRSITVDDTSALLTHREALLDGGATLRPLFRSIVGDPRYRTFDDDVTGPAGDSDPTAAGEPGAVPLKMVTPAQLAAEVEGLTGWRWTVDGIDALASDLSGVETLAGGFDGFAGTRRARTANPTVVLVQERLAEAAADAAVADDPAGLFAGMDLDGAPTADDVATLYLRVLTRRVDADSAEVARAVALWDALDAVDGDARGAWAGLLSALLRDPAVVYY